MVEIRLEDLQQQDGRYYYTFTPQHANEKVVLPHLGCFGTTNISKIQIERGLERTEYVEPEVKESVLSGFFKQLHAVNVRLQDEVTGLSNTIKVNEQAYTRSLQDAKNNMESFVGQTKEGLITYIDSKDKALSTFIEQTNQTIQTRVTREDVESMLQQTADSISLDLKGKGDEIKTALNLTTNGVRIKGDLIHLSGRSLIDTGVIKNAHIADLNASKITAGTLNAANVRIINLDVNNLTGNKTQFLQSLWTATNSSATIDGARIRIKNSSGGMIEMNNVPEFRSEDQNGTATVLGRGRSQFWDSRGYSKGYIGTALEDSTTFGVHLSTGGGGFSITVPTTTTTASSSGDEYYTVKRGQGPVDVVEDLMRQGKLSSNFNTAAAHIRSLNGWPAGTWPVLHPNDKVLYKRGTIQVSTASSTRLAKMMEFTTSSTGDWRIYVRNRTQFYNVLQITSSGRLQNDSDRRLKTEIKDSQVKALDAIKQLAFKQFVYKDGGRFEPLGLIAQESGDLRVKGETESIDIVRAAMLALKGVQELQEEVTKWTKQQ